VSFVTITFYNNMILFLALLRALYWLTYSFDGWLPHRSPHGWHGAVASSLPTWLVASLPASPPAAQYNLSKYTMAFAY